MTSFSKMKIVLNSIGKRFNSEWIFKNLSHELEPGNGYAILGTNGSGKSTLLQIIAGSMMLSDGNIIYQTQDPLRAQDSGLKTHDSLFQYLSIAAPYLDLFEEYTLEESITFHSKFKNFFPGLSKENVIALTGLERSKSKQLKYFSSGMKQRVKLSLAILSNVPLLLLDEPCSNLDTEGVEWYQKLVNDYSRDRLIIVCSNRQKDEYFYCNKEILVDDYK